jgi:hypothetical protein
MRVLSLTATSRLAERAVRQAGQTVPVEELVTQLVNLDVEEDRARAGVRLAEIAGRLEVVTDDQDRPCIRLPRELKAAA